MEMPKPVRAERIGALMFRCTFNIILLGRVSGRSVSPAKVARDRSDRPPLLIVSRCEVWPSWLPVVGKAAFPRDLPGAIKRASRCELTSDQKVMRTQASNSDRREATLGADHTRAAAIFHSTFAHLQQNVMRFAAGEIVSGRESVREIATGSPRIRVMGTCSGSQDQARKLKSHIALKI